MMITIIIIGKKNGKIIIRKIIIIIIMVLITVDLNLKKRENKNNDEKQLLS